MIRPILVTASLFLAATSCGPIPQRLAEAPPLTRSVVCKVAGQETWGRPSSTPQAWITMNNDGGWCWMDSSEFEFGRQIGPFLKVTMQPSYGALQIAPTEKSTRVAYRPNPGFVGNDRFQTNDETINIKVDYLVTVTK